MTRKLPAALAALLFIAGLQGCTLFRWGGSTTPAAPPPQPQAEDLFKEGESLLAKGRYDDARTKYTTVKEKDPERLYEPLVQVRLGDSYYEEARYPEAEVEYQRFLDLHPHNKAAAYVKYQIGMCSFKQMDEPDRDPSFSLKSVQQFGELLKDYPDNPYIAEAKEKLRIAKNSIAEHEFNIGWYYYQRGVYKAAVERFKGIRESYPGMKNEPDTLYYLADSCIHTGEMETAKSALAVLYQEYPNNLFAEKAKKDLSGRVGATK
jgi:outer membrane protein assembly factor BamD